jgi:hypothetical protein
MGLGHNDAALQKAMKHRERVYVGWMRMARWQ